MHTTLTFVALLTLGAIALPTAQASPTPAEGPVCVTVYDFPDLGWRVCVAPNDAGCRVYEYRTTILGTEKNCLVPVMASSTAAGAQDLDSWPKCFPAAVGSVCVSPYWPGCNVWVVWTAAPIPPTCLYRSDPPAASSEVPWPGGSTPDVQCMDVYSETYLVGPYWLVRRDSCSAQLYECPEGYDPPAPPCREASLLEASAVASGPDCYPVYTRNDVGTVSVVRRTSCSVPEVYRCPYEGAPIDRCHRVTDGILAFDAQASLEPMCMPHYQETRVGPVTRVQRDSCHSETYVCQDDDRVHEQDETLGAFVDRQVADPGTEETSACVADFLGESIAWG